MQILFPNVGIVEHPLAPVCSNFEARGSVVDLSVRPGGENSDYERSEEDYRIILVETDKNDSGQSK